MLFRETERRGSSDAEDHDGLQDATKRHRRHTSNVFSSLSVK